MTTTKYNGIEVEQIACYDTNISRQSDGFEIIYVDKGEIKIGIDTAKQGEIILINPKQAYAIEKLSEKAKLVSIKMDMVKIWENEERSNQDISNEYICRAIEYMEQNLKDVTAVEMAEYVGVSYTYFLKLFKDVTGCNFVKFVNNMRIQKSQRLLLETNKTLDKIAAEVGFSTTSHFIKVFKQNIGITPSTYRRQVLYGRVSK